MKTICMKGIPFDYDVPWPYAGGLWSAAAQFPETVPTESHSPHTAE